MPSSIPTTARPGKSVTEPENSADGTVTIVTPHQNPDVPPASSPEPFEESNIKLSKKRWFVLFAIAVFGLSQAFAGDTGSIFNLLLELLDLKVDQYIYISQIYHYMTLIFMGPTAIFVDKFGIRTATHAAVCFFVLNGLFKALLYFTRLPGWAAYKMYYYLASCFFGTQTYLLYILLPLKVSETWFSTSERSVAWTILTLQRDIGTLFASFLFPRLIKKVDDFKLLACIYMVSVATTTVSCVACVTRSAPDHPPSLRMAESSKVDQSSFFVSVKNIFKHRDILLHVVHNGVFMALYFAVASVMQDIMINNGLTPIFVGNYMSIDAIVAIIMLLTMSSFVHKVENTLLACKLGSFGQSALFLVHLAALDMSAPGSLLVIITVFLTICRSFVAPHFMNIMAHMACGTVSQATIVGFSVIICTVLMSIAQTVFAFLIDTHKTQSKYTNSLMFLGIACIINEVIYLMFFQGKSSAPLEAGSERAVDNRAYEHDQEASR